jgi:DNA polymerase-1
VVGTYHPAAVARQWKLGAILQYDLKKALREAERPAGNDNQRTLLTNPTQADVIQWVTNNIEAPHISYDIETSYTNIECIGFSTQPAESICIPTTTRYWGSIRMLKNVLEMVDTLLTNSAIHIGQNISFDIQYLARIWGMIPNKPWADTMLMQHACYSELPKGLDFLASIYTNEPYYKDDLKTWMSDKTNDQMLWEYNAKDAAVTLECFYALNQELDMLGGHPTYDYMMDLLEPLIFMMLKGVLIDQDAISRHRTELTIKADIAEEKFRSKYGDINMNSPKQMMELITKLGLKVPIKDGKPTADKKALEKLAVKNPEFREVINVRESRKLISVYLDAPIDPIDGRWHASFNSAGTETGRLSSSKGVFGSGTNLQNVPKHIRDIIIPDPGKVITEADLRGAEALVVAHLTNDPILLRLFEEGQNIHTHTAKMIWRCTDEEVKEDKYKHDEDGTETMSMYYRAKRVRHSGNYLASWVSLMHQLECTAAEAKSLLERFYANSPNLVKWHAEVAAQLQKNRTLITPLGRKRIFFDRYGPELLRQAVAYVPQETVAHVINQGIINLYRTLCNNMDIDLLIQVHDSLVIQHLPEQTEMVHAAIKEQTKVDITINNRTFFIPIDIKTGKTWRLE